ncbi:MAG: hypothetical protein ACXVB1_16940 [Pseudobdellovibrionaceae bacterium]
MKTCIKKYIMVLLALAGLVACSNKSDYRAARTADPGLETAGIPTCSAGQQSVGRIYENGSNSGASSFEEQVKALLSATVDPKFFGTISGSNGVTLEGRLRYDGSGHVLLDQSNMKILIHDSMVGQLDSNQQVIPAYPINFNTAAAGSVNLQTKEFTLQFKDAYGEINLSGVIGSVNVTGTISYQNYANVTGGQNAAGVLGDFSIPTCGWIN